MRFELLMKTKIPTNEEVHCLKSLRCVFIMLINVKMPTIVASSFKHCSAHSSPASKLFLVNENLCYICDYDQIMKPVYNSGNI